MVIVHLINNLHRTRGAIKQAMPEAPRVGERVDLGVPGLNGLQVVWSAWVRDRETESFVYEAYVEQTAPPAPEAPKTRA